MSEVPPDPAPDAEWELWCQDTFDYDASPIMVGSGRGLVVGLMELWEGFLLDHEQGEAGFSDFQLDWKGVDDYINIEGRKSGIVNLRQWIFGSNDHISGECAELAESRLLRLVAVAHAHLLLAGQSIETIMNFAGTTKSQSRLEAHLVGLSSASGATTSESPGIDTDGNRV